MLKKVFNIFITIYTKLAEENIFAFLVSSLLFFALLFIFFINFKDIYVNQINDHDQRVVALSIHEDLLLTGSRDSRIIQRDLRSINSTKTYFNGPEEEICGIKWSPSGEYFACGSNDNTVMVFSPKTRLPIMKKRHNAAVKALDWSPTHRGILATGGGSRDCKIKLWNINKRCLANEIDTGSQVCTLKFSKRENEIVSTHGFSQNEISLWKSPNLNKVKTLYGHNQRVLFSAISPDGSYLATGAGDETLRFWDLGYNKKDEDNIKEENSNFKSGKNRKLVSKMQFRNNQKSFNISVLR